MRERARRLARAQAQRGDVAEPAARRRLAADGRRGGGVAGGGRRRAGRGAPGDAGGHADADARFGRAARRAPERGAAGRRRAARVRVVGRLLGPARVLRRAAARVLRRGLPPARDGAGARGFGRRGPVAPARDGAGPKPAPGPPMRHVPAGGAAAGPGPAPLRGAVAGHVLRRPLLVGAREPRPPELARQPPQPRVEQRRPHARGRGRGPRGRRGERRPHRPRRQAPRAAADRRVHLPRPPLRLGPGQDKRAKFPTSKAPFSAVSARFG